MLENNIHDSQPIHEGTPHGPYLPHPELEPNSVISPILYQKADEDPGVYQYMKIRDALIKAHLQPQDPVPNDVFAPNYNRLNRAIDDAFIDKAEQQVKSNVESDEYVRNSRQF
ncbi:MAG: hypothetical protein QG628_536 [Patescibacteria group bacterium]|jgi:hypothetical protein|nr:hypothetical protein [Patescibacteria group bacterium]